MNILNFKEGEVVLVLPFEKVLINGNYYSEPVAVCRLLTPAEFMRVTKIDTDFPSAKTSLEDNVLSLCFKYFVGIRDSIDWDAMEGGHVSSIVNAIIFKSGYYLSAPIETMTDLVAQVSFVETVQAIVARFLMIPFPEVLKMPIDQLYKYYAISIKAFPSEVAMPHAPEKEDDQPVPNIP